MIRKKVPSLTRQPKICLRLVAELSWTAHVHTSCTRCSSICCFCCWLGLSPCSKQKHIGVARCKEHVFGCQGSLLLSMPCSKQRGHKAYLKIKHLSLVESPSVTKPRTLTLRKATVCYESATFESLFLCVPRPKTWKGFTPQTEILFFANGDRSKPESANWLPS